MGHTEEVYTCDCGEFRSWVIRAGVVSCGECGNEYTVPRSPTTPNEFNKNRNQLKIEDQEGSTSGD